MRMDRLGEEKLEKKEAKRTRRIVDGGGFTVAATRVIPDREASVNLYDDHIT